MIRVILFYNIEQSNIIKYQEPTIANIREILINLNTKKKKFFKLVGSQNFWALQFKIFNGIRRTEKYLRTL